MRSYYEVIDYSIPRPRGPRGPDEPSYVTEQKIMASLPYVIRQKNFYYKGYGKVHSILKANTNIIIGPSSEKINLFPFCSMNVYLVPNKNIIIGSHSKERFIKLLISNEWLYSLLEQSIITIEPPKLD
jgi:hypothetical protein